MLYHINLVVFHHINLFLTINLLLVKIKIYNKWFVTKSKLNLIQFCKC